MDWGYVAGFFDGEGSVYLHKKKYLKRAIRIDISQKDIAPLLEIETFLKNNNIHCTIRPHGQHDLHKLSILRQKDAAVFLGKLAPLVIVKKKKISEILEYWFGYIPKYPVLSKSTQLKIERYMKLKIPYATITSKLNLRSRRQIDYVKRLNNIPSYY